MPLPVTRADPLLKHSPDVGTSGIYLIVRTEGRTRVRE